MPRRRNHREPVCEPGALRYHAPAGMVTSDQRLGELRPLEEALGYRNRHVVDRFVESHALPRDEAEDLFVETLRWLWLCRRADRDPAAPELFIDECMALLDEMWHTFVLFTREYTRYCETYLGGYVHHEPTTSEQKASARREIERDPVGFSAQREARLRALYGYVYEQLGEETLIKWYSTYPDRYGANQASASAPRPTRAAEQSPPPPDTEARP
jgi:hypothetical protein